MAASASALVTVKSSSVSSESLALVGEVSSTLQDVLLIGVNADGWELELDAWDEASVFVPSEVDENGVPALGFEMAR